MRKNKHIALAITIPLSFALLTGCAGGNSEPSPTPTVEQTADTPVETTSVFNISPEVTESLKLENDAVLSGDNDSLPIDAKRSLKVIKYGTTSAPIDGKLPAANETFHVFRMAMDDSGDGAASETPTLKVKVDGKDAKVLSEIAIAKENSIVVSAKIDAPIVLEVQNAQGNVGTIDLKTGEATSGAQAPLTKSYYVPEKVKADLNYKKSKGTVEVEVEDFKASTVNKNNKNAKDDGFWVEFAVKSAKVEYADYGVKGAEKENFKFTLKDKNGKSVVGKNDDGNVSFEMPKNANIDKATIVTEATFKITETGETLDTMNIKIDVPVEAKK